MTRGERGYLYLALALGFMALAAREEDGSVFWWLGTVLAGFHIIVSLYWHLIKGGIWRDD